MLKKSSLICWSLRHSPRFL